MLQEGRSNVQPACDAHQVEDALAAGASLEAFLPPDSLAGPSRNFHNARQQASRPAQVGLSAMRLFAPLQAG